MIYRFETGIYIPNLVNQSTSRYIKYMRTDHAPYTYYIFYPLEHSKMFGKFIRQEPMPVGRGWCITCGLPGGGHVDTKGRSDLVQDGGWLVTQNTNLSTWNVVWRILDPNVIIKYAYQDLQYLSICIIFRYGYFEFTSFLLICLHGFATIPMKLWTIRMSKCR